MEQEKVRNELEQFKKYLVLHHSLREITIQNHLGNIRRMIQTLETTNPEKEEIENYVYEIRNSDKSSSHQCNNLVSIEKYSDFKHILMRFAKPKRQRKLIKEVLTEAEVSRMIQATKDIKEKAIITLLAYTGVRNRSFCNIKLRDIDFGNNSLTVREVKGNEEYIANIPSEVIKILLNYLESYPRKLDDYLFTTKQNNNQYSMSDIRKFVKVLGERAKLEKKCYPHLFRHSLVSNMNNRGASIVLIKEQAGHKWIQSTEIYLQRFPQRIKSEFEIFKPSYI